MKLKRKRRKVTERERPTLVGFSIGKATVDRRLFPLRMDRKYKNTLEQAEREVIAKISQRDRLVQQGKCLTGLMKNLERENRGNCNTDLLKELDENKKTLQRKLKRLHTELESETMKGSTTIPEGMAKRNVNYVSNEGHASDSTASSVRQGNKEKPWSFEGSNQPVKANSKCAGEERSRRTGIFKSQIFIRKSNSQAQPINIDLFSTGQDLLQVLSEELGEEIKAYNIVFGTNQVDLEKTLFEQEIYHGTTVDLNIRLQGGMYKRKKSAKRHKKKKNSPIATEIPHVTESPEMWTRQQVAEWVSNKCVEYEIDESEVLKLKSQNGKGLDELSEKDWIRRSENHGDLFFKMWQTLKQNSSSGKVTDDDNKDKLLQSPLSKDAEEESPILDSGNCSNNTVNQSDFSNEILGEVSNITEIEDLAPLEDFATDGKSTTPTSGSTISVGGILEGRPRMIGNSGTLLIRDEQKSAATPFNALKVDFRGNEGNAILRPYAIKSVLNNIRTGYEIALKGRVEALEESDLLECKALLKSNEQCEFLRFKLVIDSDRHSFVYVKRNTVAFKRQLSQPPWLHNFILGDLIEKSIDMVFWDSQNIDEIIKYVVAFKNSYHGNILVGVTKDSESSKGKISGLAMDEDEMAKWREKLSMAIGHILPSPNDSAAICSTKEEALQLYEKDSFILTIALSEPKKYITWVHVPKGEARLYVTKGSDIHSYVRSGAETKRITDFNELFSRLDSLGSRKIVQIADEELDIEKQYEELTKKNVGVEKKYQVLKELSYENQEQEFKMIFGDNPVKTIQDKYLTHYSCAFLNSIGGSIIFGIQEDERSKIGHIVGIVMATKERESLVKAAAKTLTNFYPAVNTSQYNVVFHDVTVPRDFIAKDKDGMCIMIRGPADEVGNKWPKFAKDNFPGCLCRVIKVDTQLFCIVSETFNADREEIVRLFILQNKKKISLESMHENVLERLLKELCIIEFAVKRSQYPIHMVHPIDTYVFDKDGNLLAFDYKIMMQRFELGFDSSIPFDATKFMNHVDDFKHSGNSYMLIASPFKFSPTENDVYGLVIPKWALAIDFDQYPKHEGHLCQLFNDFNDLHQMERNHWIRTPQDSSLNLHPDGGICWLAARGYNEIEKSLSTNGHGSWNMSHREQLRSLLKTDLAGSIKPNFLNVVVLWDQGHDEIVHSLHVILEDILSMNGNRTSVTIVCCTTEARRYIMTNLVKPLQKSYGQIIIEERVYVAPPHVLAMHLSSKLKDPYKPENEFQVPHKREYRGKPQIFPRILPKHLRQNINGYLEMMYIHQERKNEQSTAKERQKFYSGSKITSLGLRKNFGIPRVKMDELETNFKILLNDRKSHVSMISVKVERGAGSTTLCLQFLFKHHEEYPCAQLTDFCDGLLSYIKDICRETKLPLILFVDDEIAHLQDFFDFTKELVESRHVNVILLFIEPKEANSRKESSFPRKAMNKTRMKSASDHSIYGTCPYKEVILRRQLEPKEMDNLTQHLIDIKKNREGQLRQLREKSKLNPDLRTFVHFGLTAFGEEFSGLNQYVKYRLQKVNEKQKNVLIYLSLTHVFTNSLLPANALADFLECEKVNLDAEFSDPYLHELLSPPGDEMDSRRISFHEVAQAILKLLGFDGRSQNDGSTYNWLFIKLKSVEMAKHVLSINSSTKSIDRLTRRLFVTSEYESEKFSSLIRAMTNDKCKDIARDTLLELVDIFPEQTSFGAHLLAHLAKYYMIELEKFDKAIPKIEKAVKNQKDDSLLRHIHGDIIRIHVQNLKSIPEIDMPTIVKHAIQSSDCFAFVRGKRPNVSHGYISDAMVRITVMQAAIKEMGGGKDTSFIDYLCQMIDNMTKEGNHRLLVNEKYLLSLIPDIHQFLNEDVIDPDHKEKWKGDFLRCIGKLENLRKLCDEIKKQKHVFEREDSVLLNEVALQILILNNSLEIERRPLNPLEIERLVKEVYDPETSRTISEQQMKYWLRHSRHQKKVPNLEQVRKEVKNWMHHAKKKGGISPDAEFYNYVINFMIAIKDPKDRDKREMTEKIMKRQQGKKFRRKEDSVLPIEWLCAKDRHVNSIDSLLHHDDLVKETSKLDKKQRDKQRGRDVIEGFLFEKNVIKWEGVVKEIQRDWQGTIVFKKHFEVRFVPQNVQPSMPTSGETVRFCLSFDRLGLMAWAVVRTPQNSVHKSILEAVSSEEESDSEGEDQNNEEDEVVLDTTVFNRSVSVETEATKKVWEDYNGERMQGVVVSTNPEKGFGRLEHPNVAGDLFFHASQLFKPVKSLKGKIFRPMVLEFKVEKLTERTRAADIHVLMEEEIDAAVARLRDEKQASPSTSRREKEQNVRQRKIPDTKRWEEGVVIKLASGHDFGFIKPDSKEYGRDIFFHRNSLMNREQRPHVDDRVQFYTTQTKKGYEANDIRVQSQSASAQNWDQLTGIQEGVVDSISDDGGYITSESNSHLGFLQFYTKDVLDKNTEIHDGTKVHFKTIRRGGRTIAVEIYVIGALKQGK